MKLTGEVEIKCGEKSGVRLTGVELVKVEQHALLLRELNSTQFVCLFLFKCFSLRRKGFTSDSTHNLEE
jgi:hypothetical protein